MTKGSYQILRKKTSQTTNIMLISLCLSGPTHLSVQVESTVQIAEVSLNQSLIINMKEAGGE